MNALLIIAPENFRDEEYFHTKEELEKEGISVITASKSTEEAEGMMGGRAKPDLTLEEAKVADYAAIVFIGGSGASVYFNDNLAHFLAKKAYTSGKILAAICIAPSILANAGILKGKNMTSFPSEQENVTKKGGNYLEAPIVEDGKIITANGPDAARAFGKNIAKAIRNANMD